MSMLTAKDNRAKKGMVFEVEDYRDEGCVVTCFKKVSMQNPQLRMNCFVSQFEFSRRDDDEIEDAGVQDTLQDSEHLLKQICGEAKTSADEEVAASPFVYLMNKAKMEAMARDDHLEVAPRFSMFNRQTEYPFDPVPNVTKIPPADEDTL